MLLLGLIISTSLNATENPKSKIDEVTEAEKDYNTLQEKADVLMLKIMDLKRAKKAANTKEEKREIKSQAKELRSELNALEAEAKAKGQDIKGGIYIGTGTLILILILILLL